MQDLISLERRALTAAEFQGLADVPAENGTSTQYSGPKHSTKVGKTPVLTAAETRMLLDSIDTDTLVGLRDRALIGVMVYSFGRISAAIGMSVSDYYMHGKRSHLRLHEKGGKYNVVPAHHLAQDYLDAYVGAAGIADGGKTPLSLIGSWQA